MAKKSVEEQLVDNKIILRSTYSKTGIKIFTNPCRDPKTKQYPYSVKRINSQGDMILTEAERNSGDYFIPEDRMFTLEDGTVFNLSDENQRREWDAIKFCPYIAKSRDERDENGNLVIDGSPTRYGVAELYIDNPGVETEKRVSKKKLIFQACSHIYNDDKGAEGRVIIAKLLGKYVRGMADADVIDYLISVADKNPEQILEIYESDDTAYRLLFLKAREDNIIAIKNKVYVFGDVLLGATDSAVLTWLKNPKNSATVELIKREAYPNLFAQ